MMKKTFSWTIFSFYSIIIVGAVSRLFTSFWGLISTAILIIALYLFSAIYAVIRIKPGAKKSSKAVILRILFAVSFIIITGYTFAARRRIMGFDIMRMDVPVMKPTILTDEKFLIDTWIYKETLPKAGDLIAHSFNEQKGLYLNRIVAVPNDKIEIKNGTLFLNGRSVKEPYLSPVNVTKPQSLYQKTQIVPAGHYFVMGDNRDASFGDSRFGGTITIRDIVGKVTDIISSPDKTRIGLRLK